MMTKKDMADLLDKVEAAHAHEPYVVAKTEMLKVFLGKCRLRVRADDVFVDQVDDGDLLFRKRDRRCRDFGRRTPGLEDTALWLKGSDGAPVWNELTEICFELHHELNRINPKLTFRDAQRHPERYEDLQVRVCGWNVRWNDLSKLEQDHFILTATAQE